MIVAKTRSVVLSLRVWSSNDSLTGGLESDFSKDSLSPEMNLGRQYENM